MNVSKEELIAHIQELKQEKGLMDGRFISGAAFCACLDEGNQGGK